MILSIITINLNNSNGLRKTIESVIDQKSTDIEYLIIDGASTDGSVNIIQEYSNRIDYWTSECDSGIYNAMNKGIMNASGQYCLFLNSGDYLIENALRRICLEDFKEQIVYGNIILNFKDRPSVRFTGAGRSNLTFFDFYAGNSICHQAAFIRRELFNLYGLYDESYKIVSDWAFFMKVVIMENVTVRYINTDISYFDPFGIGTVNIEETSFERQLEFSKILPEKISTDFCTMKLLIDENNVLLRDIEKYNKRYRYLDNTFSVLKGRINKLVTMIIDKRRKRLS